MKEFHYNKHKCIPEEEYAILNDAIQVISNLLLKSQGGMKEKSIINGKEVITKYPFLGLSTDENTIKNALYIINSFVMSYYNADK